MNALFKIWQKLRESKDYREAFVQAQAKRAIPLQIRVLLKQRNWSQARLAQEAKLTQGAISRAQDPDYGNLTINTLVRIAAGFDVAFVGRFVPFSDLGRWYTDLSEQTMEVPSFEDDTGFIERMPAASALPAYCQSVGNVGAGQHRAYTMQATGLGIRRISLQQMAGVGVAAPINPGVRTNPGEDRYEAFHSAPLQGRTKAMNPPTPKREVA